MIDYSRLRQQAVDFAFTQIGVREERTNWSPQIAKYLDKAGITVAAPWCAAFVFWCVYMAYRHLQILGEDLTNPLEAVPLPALVASYIDTARAKGWIVDEPRKGDLFAIDFGGSGGHLGFVDGVLEDGRILTIEGNTNEEGSREGVAVMQRIRRPTSAYTIIRYR